MYRVLHGKPHTKYVICSISLNPHANPIKRNLEIISFYRHRNLRDFKGVNSRFDPAQLINK